MSNRATLAAAIAMALSAPAFAAVQVTESFDGAWFNPQQSGRGMLVDVIPGTAGSVTFFGAQFTYDNAGNPFWITIQPVLAEGQFRATGFEVRRFNGGNFGNNFTPPNPGSGTVIGTGTLEINSCNSFTLNIVTNAASNGLPNVDLNYQRLGPVPKSCVWTQPFTACPAGTTAVTGQARTCALTGTITQNLTLRNNATYLLNGKVQIGQPMNNQGVIGTTANLTIEPGTLIKGGGGSSDYLVINPGSRIFAEGTRSAPIIFTGPTEAGGSWAGLLIAGRAPVNNGSPAAVFEADATIFWGGSDPNDSSGVLRYVQVRHGGQTIAPNRELNTITLGGVGAGTVLEFVHSHNGTDDGFEFFGGTVNGRYLISTGNDDDSFDFDTGGYTGRIQYAFAAPDLDIDVADGRCVEADNQPADGNFNATPRGQPKVANLTCLGKTSGPNWFEGIRLRRGVSAQFQNVVIANAAGAGSSACIRFNDAATYAAIGNPPSATTMVGGFLGSCATNFRDDSAAGTLPITVQAWYTGQAGNATGDAAAALDGRFARAGGPLDGTGVAGSNLFDRTTFKGAFGPDKNLDWADGWTVPGALD